MMILASELIPLIEAANSNPSGLRIPFPTIYRWARVGYRGLRLEVVYIGRRIFTSHKAVADFLNQISQMTRSVKPADGAKETGERQQELAIA